MAVRPSPKRSIATPTRGEMSFQFCTVPTHPALRVVLAVSALAERDAAVESARRHLALLRLADEPVVAQAQVPRDAAHRPAVLQEDAGVGLDAVAAVGRQAQRHLTGPSGVVGDRLHVAGPLLEQPPVAFADTWRRGGTSATRSRRTLRPCRCGALRSDRPGCSTRSRSGCSIDRGPCTPANCGSRPDPTLCRESPVTPGWYSSVYSWL